jgi:hypothetical protein
MAERWESAGGGGCWAHTTARTRGWRRREAVFGSQIHATTKADKPAARKDTVGAGAHRLEGGCKKDKAMRTVQSRPAQEPRKAAGSSSSSRAPQGVRVKHSRRKFWWMIILIVCAQENKGHCDQYLHGSTRPGRRLQLAVGRRWAGLDAVPQNRLLVARASTHCHAVLRWTLCDQSVAGQQKRL